MRRDGRRLDFNRVAAWAGPGYPVGCLEYVDFRTMASLATLDDNDHYLEQRRSTTFTWSADETQEVNGIALYVWVGFVNDSPGGGGGTSTTGARSTRSGLRSASVATGFPYGCEATVGGPDAPPNVANSSFSSCTSDDAYADSWRNLVLVLPRSIRAGWGAVTTVCVETVAQLGRVRNRQPSPRYTFTVSIVNASGGTTEVAVFALDMAALYPVYGN